MGLFDFIKDVEHKLDGSVATEASLRDVINKAGLGIQNFQVKLDRGLATISGQAASQKDLELARLMVGNHQGVQKVNDDGLQLAPQAASAAAPAQAAAATASTVQAQPATMVTVKKGDTLSKIAKEYTGNANQYQQIFEANKPMLKNPDAIFPGQIIRIPPELVAGAQH